jgi:hypothetical protein
MIKRVYLIVLLVYIGFTLGAANNESAPSRIFTLIYEQNLSAAEKTLNAEKTQLNDFYFTFLNLDLHWWKYRTTYSKENSYKLDELIESYILPETKTMDEKMRQLIVKSYQMRYAKKKFNIFEMLSARSDMKDLIEEIENENHVISGDEQKLFESYLIMFQYIENINFFANQKKSDERVKKLKRMEKFANEENVMLNTIAHFFLARMYQKVEREPEKGLEHFKILTTKFPTNTTFAEYQQECQESI